MSHDISLSRAAAPAAAAGPSEADMRKLTAMVGLLWHSPPVFNIYRLWLGCIDYSKILDTLYNVGQIRCWTSAASRSRTPRGSSKARLTSSTRKSGDPCSVMVTLTVVVMIQSKLFIFRKLKAMIVKHETRIRTLETKNKEQEKQLMSQVLLHSLIAPSNSSFLPLLWYYLSFVCPLYTIRHLTHIMYCLYYILYILLSRESIWTTMGTLERTSTLTKCDQLVI